MCPHGWDHFPEDNTSDGPIRLGSRVLSSLDKLAKNINVNDHIAATGSLCSRIMFQLIVVRPHFRLVHEVFSDGRVLENTTAQCRDLKTGQP